MQIEANGIKINFEISGQSNRPVVVLGHSLASSMVMWEPQLRVLEPHFRVLRYDMRGHGDSDATEGAYTLEHLGKDIIGLMDVLDIQRAHFVGLSIGGMIGQGLALDYPNRFARLVLCDTAPIVSEEAKPLFRERMNIARDKGMGSLADETMARWFTAPFLSKNQSVVKPIREQILATPVAGYIGCSHAILGLDYLHRLSEIQHDTLIIVGEDDPGTPVDAAEAIHREIRNSKLVILPSAAHLSNIEQADRFNDSVLEFLKEG